MKITTDDPMVIEADPCTCANTISALEYVEALSTGGTIVWESDGFKSELQEFEENLKNARDYFAELHPDLSNIPSNWFK